MSSFSHGPETMDEESDDVAVNGKSYTHTLTSENYQDDNANSENYGDIDALNSETFGDDVQNWEIDDHQEIANAFGGGFPPHSNGDAAAGAPYRHNILHPSNDESLPGAQSIDQEIHDFSKSLLSCIFDDEDDGAKSQKRNCTEKRDDRRNWAEKREEKRIWTEKREVKQIQPGAFSNNEASVQKPRVLTVQEVENQLRNPPSHSGQLRMNPVNNELPQPSMEQYYRQGAIPRHPRPQPQPGILYLNSGNHPNPHSAPHQPLPQEQVPIRPTTRLYQRAPTPGHQVGHQGHAGNPHYPPQSQQHYNQGPAPFQEGHYNYYPPQNQGYIHQGGMMRREQAPFNMHPRMQGQFPMQPRPEVNFRSPPQPYRVRQTYFLPPPSHHHQQYLKYQNAAVPIAAHSHHMDDRRIRQHDYADVHNNGSFSDEYANLMSQQEKTFLKNIQLNALNIQNPYMDDFYFTMFKQGRNNGGNSENQGNYGRDIRSSNREQPPRQEYSPQQFDNVLGKIQAGSVSAPRKIIDTERVESETGNFQEGVKLKNTLLDIEAGYTLNRVVDEASFFHMPENDVNRLTQNLITFLQQKIDTFAHIDKGKELLRRAATKQNTPSDFRLQVMMNNAIAYGEDNQSSLFFDLLPDFEKDMGTANISTILQQSKLYLHIIIWDKALYINTVAIIVGRMAKIYKETGDRMTDRELQDYETFLIRLGRSLPRGGLELVPRPIFGVDRYTLERHLRLIFQGERASDIVKPLLNHLSRTQNGRGPH